MTGDAERLRAAGLRVTPARLAILDPVRAGNHPGTEEIARAARDRGGDHQHQIVCRRCGAVADAGAAIGPAACLAPGAGAGFTIDQVQVTFWGLCAGCRAPGSTARSPAATGHDCPPA